MAHSSLFILSVFIGNGINFPFLPNEWAISSFPYFNSLQTEICSVLSSFAFAVSMPCLSHYYYRFNYSKCNESGLRTLFDHAEKCIWVVNLLEALPWPPIQLDKIPLEFGIWNSNLEPKFNYSLNWLSFNNPLIEYFIASVPFRILYANNQKHSLNYYSVRKVESSRKTVIFIGREA